MSASSLYPAPSSARYLLRSGVVSLLLVVSLVLAAEHQTAATDFAHKTAGNEPAEAGLGAQIQRLREGTKIVDQLGYFKITGDRVTFYTEDEKYRFGGLENLNLERIFRTLSDNPDRLMWSITGTITEYRGSNFLQISRAVLKKNIRRPGNQQPSQSPVDQALPQSRPLIGS